MQGSLERLGLQYVDIVFAHGRDASTSIEGEMKSLTKYDRLTLLHGKGRDKLSSKQGFLQMFFGEYLHRNRAGFQLDCGEGYVIDDIDANSIIIARECLRNSIGRGFLEVDRVCKGTYQCFDASLGWAFYWGTCQWTQAQIMEAYTVARLFHLIPPLVDQSEYNFFKRQPVELAVPELLCTIGKPLGVFSWSDVESGSPID